jgi:hypothetical protein
MKNEWGLSAVPIVLAVAIVAAAAGGGFYAWQQHQQLAQARRDLSETKSALDKAMAESQAAKAEAAAARKELDEQKAALAQLKSERDSAVVLLEAEKAHSTRLQSDLTLAREQIAFVRSRSSAVVQPTLAPRPAPVPMLHGRGSAVSAARPAAPPSMEAQPVSR